MAKVTRVAEVKPDLHRQTMLFQWTLATQGVRALNEFKERF